MSKLNSERVSWYAYVVVIIAFFTNFVANYPQYQLSPLAMTIMPQYNLDVAQFSSLFSSAMIPGILLGIPAGLLCDRFGLKRCIGLAAVLSAIGVVARIFVGDFTGIFVCMLVSGIVASFFNSNAAKIVGNWFPPEKIGVGVGFAMAGATAAMAVGMGTTALLPGVQAAFVVAGVLSVLLVVVWWLFMREKPAGAQQDSPAAPAFEQPTFGECIKVVGKNKHIWIVAFAIGLILAASMIIVTFLPQALQAVRGFDAASAGGVSAVITFGNLAGTILVPIINARVGRMKPIVLACCAVGALGTAFAWLAPAGLPIMVCLFMTGFCSSGVITSLLAVPVMLAGIGPVYAGTAGGLVGTIELILSVVLPSYIIAPLVGANFNVLYLVGGCLAVASGVLILFIPEVLKKKKEREAEAVAVGA